MCTFKEGSGKEKKLSAPLSPKRELAERKQNSEQKPSLPTDLLFSVKCVKPGGSFSTGPGIFSALWDAGCWAHSASLVWLRASLRPGQAGELGQQGSLDVAEPRCSFSLSRLGEAKGVWGARRAAAFPSSQGLGSRNLAQDPCLAQEERPC